MNQVQPQTPYGFVNCMHQNWGSCSYLMIGPDYLLTTLKMEGSLRLRRDGNITKGKSLRKVPDLSCSFPNGLSSCYSFCNTRGNRIVLSFFYPFLHQSFCLLWILITTWASSILMPIHNYLCNYKSNFLMAHSIHFALDSHIYQLL